MWRGAGLACPRRGFALGSGQGSSRIFLVFLCVSNLQILGFSALMELLSRLGWKIHLVQPFPSTAKATSVPRCHLHRALNPPGITPPLWILATGAPRPWSLQTCRRSLGRARRKWSSSTSVTISPHPKGSWCLQALQNNGFDLPARASRPKTKPGLCVLRTSWELKCAHNSEQMEICCPH